MMKITETNNTIPEGKRKVLLNVAIDKTCCGGSLIIQVYRIVDENSPLQDYDIVNSLEEGDEIID